MPQYSFQLNGKDVQVDAPANLPALWTLREKLGVTGPKYGCGINVCKACTSHLNDAAFNDKILNVCRWGTCARIRVAIRAPPRRCTPTGWLIVS